MNIDNPIINTFFLRVETHLIWIKSKSSLSSNPPHHWSINLFNKEAAKFIKIITELLDSPNLITINNNIFVSRICYVSNRSQQVFPIVIFFLLPFDNHRNFCWSLPIQKSWCVDFVFRSETYELLTDIVFVFFCRQITDGSLCVSMQLPEDLSKAVATTDDDDEWDEICDRKPASQWVVCYITLHLLEVNNILLWRIVSFAKIKFEKLQFWKRVIKKCLEIQDSLPLSIFT